MFGFIWKKTDKEFNLDHSYLVIEFLTEEEKIKKDKTVEALQSQYQDNVETIIPYKQSFQCSYRYTLFSNNIKGKILLTEIMALIEASSDSNLQQFYESNVNKVKLHMKNNKLINSDDILELYNERDISLYNPNDVLEIIYDKRGFLQRMKIKGKKFIKNLPQTIFNTLTKLLGLVLKFMGFGLVRKIFSTFLPFKMIFSCALNFLMVFFPALAPLVGLSKLII